MRILTLIVFAISLCACSEKEHSVVNSKSAGKVATASVTQSVQAKTNIESKTPALSAVEMLNAFHKDIEVCKSVAKLLKDDRSFIGVDYSTPQPETLVVLARQPKYSNLEDFKHILNNKKYFIVDIANMEVGNPWAVAWTENDENIFCQLTPQRMEEIELLGESQEAWEIREYFLDKTLFGLSPITNLFGDNEVEFEYLKTLTQEASHRYLHELRPKFIGWAKKAIGVVEKERSEVKPDDVFSVDVQNKILDKRLSFFRNVVEHDGPIAYPNPNPLVGSWKWHSDRITFGVYKRGTYYRNGAVCFEFSYSVQGDELLRVGDKPDVCSLGLITRYHVSVANNTLLMKSVDSQLESNWEKIPD
jgi:hypothetical protein